MMRRRQFNTLLIQSTLIIFVSQKVAQAHVCSRPDCQKCNLMNEILSEIEEVS